MNHVMKLARRQPVVIAVVALAGLEATERAPALSPALAWWPHVLGLKDLFNLEKLPHLAGLILGLIHLI